MKTSIINSENRRTKNLYSIRNYFRALKYVKRYRMRMIKILILATSVFLIFLLPPLVIKILIDNVFVHQDLSLLNLVILGLGIIFFFGLLFDFFQNYMLTTVGQHINFDIRTHLFSHLQGLSLKFYDLRRGGELIYRLFTDTGSIQTALSDNIIAAFINAGTVIVIAGAMLYLNWKLSLISFVSIFLLVFIVVFFRRPILNYTKALREKDALLFSHSSECFAGIKTIKACATEKSEVKKFRSASKERVRLGIKSNVLGRIARTIARFIYNLATLFVLWYGGHQVIKGDLTVGSLVAFLLFTRRLNAPVLGLTRLALGFQRTLVGLGRVYEIFDTTPDITEDREAPFLPQIKGKVEFKKVSFSYEPNKTVLKNINITVEPGMKVALVGRSGAGKTTLASLIARFYEPTSGSIFIDGYDIRKVRLNSLRNQIGVVLENPFLFSGTIADNIAYGREETAEKEIIKAAKAANIHDFIISLPQKYKTTIGEKGVRLSGGEKQRIAIARAILRNPRILILDEATSSVDLESEALIQEALKRLMKGRTTFIIAHRLSTIKQADKILVIDDGRIVETGKHEGLLKKKRMYYRLYERMTRI